MGYEQSFAMLQLLVVTLPLCLAFFATWRHSLWLAITAPLPAAALLLNTKSQEIVTFKWLLFGVQLGLDATSRAFMMASALVWFLAAVYAAGSLRRSPNASRFNIFFLLAMAGNFALILAQDITTFFVGFTLMGFSAYGLVIHEQSAYAQRAGRLYLSWTILGEMSLFCAFVMIVATYGNLNFSELQTIMPSHSMIALVVVGLGIKLALPGLHVWIPFTYSATPAAGAAVLSGPMINAGLLGWIRFLPFGNESVLFWGNFLIAIGIVGAAYGIIAAIFQQNPKVILAYSSMSKMGVLASGFGIALAHPLTAPLILSTITLYAVLQSLAKSGLFLGVDLLECGKDRVFVVAGLVFLGLASVGAPLTIGALAKVRLINELPENMSWFSWWLTVTTFGSTLLFGRLLYLLVTARITPRGIDNNMILVTWSAMIVVLIATPFFVSSPQAMLSGGLPVALSMSVVLLVLRFKPRVLTTMVGLIPPGDILQLVNGGVKLVQSRSIFAKTEKRDRMINIRRDQRRHSIMELMRKFHVPLTDYSSKSAWFGVLWMTLLGLTMLAIIFT